jgi:phenylalanyl-tRNA synthetase beta chain
MPLEELAERLSISTAEVEGIERSGVPDQDGNLGLFRVGKVLEAAKHPERRSAPALPGRHRRRRTRADRLRRLELRRWRDRCGRLAGRASAWRPAARAAQGTRRALDGMILAEDEIELGTDHSGIMVLPETEPGTPLGDVLPLVEDVLLVESTGNRPDLLSIYGLAREIAASTSSSSRR